MNLLQHSLHTKPIRSIILIRLLTGVFFLSEGVQKFLFAEKIGAGRFEKIGLPHPQLLGPFVGSVEIICGLLLLIGLCTRLASIPLIIIMLVAMATTKFTILTESGFWEMMHASRTDWAMLLGSLFLLINGGGKWSVDYQWQEGMNKKASLKELARLFLKLGLIGFGGPAVHIAIMEEEVVRRRQWMTHQHFLDLIGATNLIPGPNSTEMTMHIGYERGGRAGLIVAGLCFIVPAVIITAALAWAYNRYGQLPQLQPFIYGIKPAVIAVVVATMLHLGKKALKSFQLGIIGVAAAVAVLAGMHEIVVLFGAGAIGILLCLAQKQRASINGFLPFTLLQISGSGIDVSGWKLFFIFLKIGSILYGSGYVLFAFLDAELVAHGLLTKQQLIDAIAVGQITPGPVFSSATFIGWQIGGASGALAATTGIFLPSFLFVAFLNPLLPRLRRSKVMSAFLDTVSIASIAIILAVVIEMSRETLLDWRTIVIALAGFAVTFLLPKLNAAFVIIGGALAGYLLWLL